MSASLPNPSLRPSRGCPIAGAPVVQDRQPAPPESPPPCFSASCRFTGVKLAAIFGCVMRKPQRRASRLSYRLFSLPFIAVTATSAASGLRSFRRCNVKPLAVNQHIRFHRRMEATYRAPRTTTTTTTTSYGLYNRASLRMPGSTAPLGRAFSPCTRPKRGQAPSVGYSPKAARRRGIA